MNHDVDAAPHWVVRLLTVCCLGLIPWTIGLAATLPRSYLVANWPLAWTGFDVILLGCLATTAWTLHKQRHVAVQASMTTSALLFCDAWFDILTAHSGFCRTVSVATAMLAEIPLALMLSVVSGRLLRANASAGVTDAAHSSIWRTPLGVRADRHRRACVRLLPTFQTVPALSARIISLRSPASQARTGETRRTFDRRTHRFDEPGRRSWSTPCQSRRRRSTSGGLPEPAKERYGIGLWRYSPVAGCVPARRAVSDGSRSR
jgi:hypothetical protein